MNLTDYAHDYHLAGFNPLPLKIDKSPALPKGERYLDEFVSTKWIDDHFTNAKKIGVAGGEVSGNLVCIDFDMHNEGENVHEVFDFFVQTEFVAYLVKTKQIALYETPSGGRHIIYRTPETESSQKLAWYSSKTIMIETKSQGGYIACYPSQGYKHLGGCDLINVCEIADEAHVEMMELARSLTKYIPTQISNSRKNNSTDIKWGESWKLNTPDGRYNTNEGDAAFQLLMDNGWQVNTRGLKDEGIFYLTRPGKSIEDGISATWGYRKNMFYVFTSSSIEFPLPIDSTEKGRAFTPFEILVSLEYDGDWRKAKDDLRELYGMKPQTKLKPIVIEDKEVVKATPFPINVLPKDYQTYILELHNALNYSPDILACAMMYTFATTIGNKVKLRVKNGWETPMIFWFSVLGLPGTLKSHPVNTVIKSLKNIDYENKKNFDESINEFNQLDDNEKKKTSRPKYNQIIITDYTLEALHQAHSYNKRGLGLHKDELIGFVKDMNKYRDGSDMEFWLESFSNESFSVIRKTQDPLLIRNIMINIIGTIQPKVMTELMNKNQGDGFIDRFLFTRAETKYHEISKKEVSKETLQWWNDYIKELHELANYIDEDDVMMSQMTSLAMDEFMRVDKKYVAMQNDETIDQSTRSYISKIKTYLPRFALMLSIMDNTDPEVAQNHIDVEPVHIVRAERIVEYFLNTAKQVFNESDEINELVEITQSMKGKSKTEKAILLKERGLKNKQIAQALDVGASRVSQMLKQSKDV